MTARLHPDFAKYRCWVFDCDGVLLDSNAVKTQAFRDVTLPYGQDVAEALATYHIEHGGISRFIKFQYLFKEILKREPENGEIDHLLEQFSQAARTRLLECPTAPRIHEILGAVAANGPVYVVSGGFQSELRDIFTERNLDQYFTAIFGSPDSKDAILERERASDTMPDPAIFVGDARYDFEVAERFGLDFVFVSDWSEFSGWQDYFKVRSVSAINTIQDLLTLE